MSVHSELSHMLAFEQGVTPNGFTVDQVHKSVFIADDNYRVYFLIGRDTQSYPDIYNTIRDAIETALDGLKTSGSVVTTVDVEDAV